MRQCCRCCLDLRGPSGDCFHHMHGGKMKSWELIMRRSRWSESWSTVVPSAGVTATGSRAVNFWPNITVDSVLYCIMCRLDYRKKVLQVDNTIMHYATCWSVAVCSFVQIFVPSPAISHKGIVSGRFVCPCVMIYEVCERDILQNTCGTLQLRCSRGQWWTD